MNELKRKYTPVGFRRHHQTPRLKRYDKTLNIVDSPVCEGGHSLIYHVAHDDDTFLPLICKITKNRKEPEWLTMRQELNQNSIGPHLFFCTNRHGAGSMLLMSRFDMDLRTYYQTYRKGVPKYMEEKLHGELQRLHDMDLVHGDIKQMNILVRTRHSEITDITLTDFDFTREIGETIDHYADEDEYWKYVNKILCRGDAQSMGEKELDIEMLQMALHRKTK